MGVVKDFVVKQTIKHGLRVASRLSERNLIRFAELVEKVAHKREAKIVKKLIKVNKIGMVNILLDDNVVPELIQNDVSEENIYTSGKKILNDKELYNSVKVKLNKVKDKLGNEGASARAAKQIYALMNET